MVSLILCKWKIQFWSLKPQKLNELEDKKAHIIGYFEKKEDAGRDNFRKAASNLKDECEFIAGYGDVIARMHPPDTDIVAFNSNSVQLL